MITKTQIKIQTFLLFITVLFLWFLYVPIGNLSAAKNINYAHYFITSWDLNTVYISLLFIPYTLTYLVCPLAAIILIIKNYDRPQIEQKIFFTYLAVVSTAFIIFYLLPTNVPMLKKIPAGAYGASYLDQLTLSSYNYDISWNSLPSLHIANAWIPYRFFKKDKYVVRYTYLLWFVLMCWGTLALNYHMIADVISGIALVEFYFVIYDKIESFINKLFAPDYYKIRFTILCIIILILSYLLYLSAIHGLFEVSTNQIR
jgi:hypothetical protein